MRRENYKLQAGDSLKFPGRDELMQVQGRQRFFAALRMTGPRQTVSCSGPVILSAAKNL